MFSRAVDAASVGPVPLAFLGPPSVPRLSMGRAAFGDRVARSRLAALAMEAGLGAHIAADGSEPLAALLVALPADVRVRCGQTGKPRCDVAGADGPGLPFRDPTAALGDGL